MRWPWQKNKTVKPVVNTPVPAWTEEPCAIEMFDGEVVFGEVRTYACGKIIVKPKSPPLNQWFAVKNDGTFDSNHTYRRAWWKTHTRQS
jgi:hypothetical protein